MNYKLINRLDPLIYLGLVLVGFILPEVVYRIFLFDFTAVLTENEAMIVRSIGAPLYFAAMAFFLLGGNAENGKQLNIIRYSGGLGLIAFAVFTDFNGFFLFGLVDNKRYYFLIHINYLIGQIFIGQI